MTHTTNNLKQITEQDVLSLFPSMKHCLIENPKSDDYEYYHIKIYFSWKWKRENKINNDGWQSFNSETKEDILEQIKVFYNNEHEDFELVKQ